MADTKNDSTTQKRAAPIRVDDESTWPQAVLEHLEKNCALLRSCIEYDERVRDMDVLVRYKQAPNPHSELRDESIGWLDRALSEHRVVGYHCTRLLDSEIEDIKAHGMPTFSREHAERKLSTAASAGLDSAVASQLRETIGEGFDRTGRIHFVFRRAQLNEECGLWKFFGFWGGEAIYANWCHVDDCALGRSLRKIGTPCIIETAIPVDTLDVWVVGERFVDAYLSARGFGTGASLHFQGSVDTAIHPENILRVITEKDPAFQNYTERDTWREEHR